MNKVMVIYDKPVDVLHLRSGSAGLFEADDLDRGVELDFSIFDGQPCGATVIGFFKNQWDDDILALAQLVSKHLSVPAKVLSKQIKRTMHDVERGSVSINVQNL